MKCLIIGVIHIYRINQHTHSLESNCVKNHVESSLGSGNIWFYATGVLTKVGNIFLQLLLSKST